MKQRNFTPSSRPGNKPDKPQANNVARCSQKAKTAPTSQRKVSSKIKVTITSEQLRAATIPFTDYDIKKPGWLRREFFINQRRRGLLNRIYRETGLDSNWCGHCDGPANWSQHIHEVWHLINGVPLC